MAKKKSKKVAAPAPTKITLAEFCSDLSAKDGRVELIGGFFHYAKFMKKVTKATSAEFAGMFQKFENRPV